MQDPVDDLFGRIAPVRVHQSDAAILSEVLRRLTTNVKQAVSGEEQNISVPQKDWFAGRRDRILEHSQRRTLAIEQSEIARLVNDVGAVPGSRIRQSPQPRVEP